MTGIRIVALKFFAFAAVSAVLLVLLVNTMLNDTKGDTNAYVAQFSDVNGLRVGDDVKVAGVRVGRVSSIEVDGESAEVGIELEDQQPILDNTSLVMRYQNLVGQRYISMVQPEQRGAELEPGTTIPLERTDPGFDLTELLNGFRPLFEVLQPADVNALATSLVKVLQGEGGTVESLLQQTTELSAFIADRDEILGAVATNLTPVLNNLSGQGNELSATVVELKKLMNALAKDRQAIGASIDGIGQLVGATSSLLDEARQPLVQAVQRLKVVAAMLAASTGNLNGAIKAFDTAFGGLGRAASYQGALNVYLCSLTVALGDSAGVNPAGNGGRYSEVCR